MKVAFLVSGVRQDGAVFGMQRVSDPAALMEWLADLPSEQATTGYDPTGWSASTWVLHAMYENAALKDFGTHDDLHRRRLDAGDVRPLIVGDVNLDSVSTVTGTPLGFVVKPGQPWQRITWEAYLARFPDFTSTREYPPSHSWFPHGSWPVAVEAPPEGSLDDESLRALVAALADHSADGADSECFAFFASLPTGDFDTIHLWKGPLRDVPNLVSDNGGGYDFSPTNLWPVDRAWFVWTDYDLQATKVSGDAALVDALTYSPALECVDWHSPSG